MPTAPCPRRIAKSRLLGGLTLGLIVQMAAACSGLGPGAPAPDPVAVPPATGSAVASADPAAAPGPAITLDTLLTDRSGRNGQLVRVTGNLIATQQDGARLCSVVLESYPPQCGGGMVRITGDVPADVLDALESTSDPALAQATWGQVEVTGTFRADGVGGVPTVELASIRVVAAGG